MKRATHSNTHSNTHSGKFPETSLATTSQPISQETSQAQLRAHLLRLAKSPALSAPWATAAVMYHAGIPGWRPGFSVTAAGSGSMNRSSRSARHRSPELPERHRACRASERARAWWGDALAYRDRKSVV